MIISTKDNNEYLLIEGTDQPQLDAGGNPIPNPNFGVVTHTEVPDPEIFPIILSATAFNKYAASKLAGGGVAGMARFMQIIDTGRSDGGTASAFAVAQYDKALTFAKEEVAAFGAILSAAGHMTGGEVAAIVDNWPNA